MVSWRIDKVEGIYEVPCDNLYTVPNAARNGESRIFRNIAVVEDRLLPMFAAEELFAQGIGKCQE